MRKLLAALALTTILAACATTGSLFGPSPEAQIKAGANTVAASATLATVALKNHKISVAQAKSYSAFLNTAGGHLNVAGDRLIECRKKTGSNEKTRPDPCAATVADDIALGIAVANQVKNTLDAKQ